MYGFCDYKPERQSAAKAHWSGCPILCCRCYLHDVDCQLWLSVFSTTADIFSIGCIRCSVLLSRLVDRPCFLLCGFKTEFDILRCPNVEIASEMLLYYWRAFSHWSWWLCETVWAVLQSGHLDPAAPRCQGVVCEMWKNKLKCSVVAMVLLSLRPKNNSPINPGSRKG